MHALKELSALPMSVVTLELLKYTVLFFVITLIGLFISLGVHKRLRSHANRVRARFIQQADAQLRAVVKEVNLALQPIRTFARAEALAHAWHAMDIQDVEQRARAKMALADAGIEAVLRRTLASRKWVLRFRCLNAIRDLAWTPLFDAVIGHTDDEQNPRVHGNCLYAGANILRTADQFLQLYEAINRSYAIISASFAESVFRTALQRVNGTVSPGTLNNVLRHCLAGLESHSLAPLMISIGKEKMGALAQPMIDCARASQKPIILISAMRACHAMGRCDSLIVENLYAAENAVQITAIRCVTHCGSGVLNSLLGLMSSPIFDVRYAASVSLRGFGAPGVRALQRLTFAEEADPYARHMAVFALALHREEQRDLNLSDITTNQTPAKYRATSLPNM